MTALQDSLSSPGAALQAENKATMNMGLAKETIDQSSLVAHSRRFADPHPACNAVKHFRSGTAQAVRYIPVVIGTGGLAPNRYKCRVSRAKMLHSVAKKGAGLFSARFYFISSASLGLIASAQIW